MRKESGRMIGGPITGEAMVPGPCFWISREGRIGGECATYSSQGVSQSSYVEADSVETPHPHR